MEIRKKYYPPKLVHYDFDLSKRWYIDCLETLGPTVWRRLKIEGKINQFDTVEERTQEFTRIIESLTSRTYKKETNNISAMEYIEAKKNLWRPKTYIGNLGMIKQFESWKTTNKLTLTNERIVDYVQYLTNKGLHKTTIGIHIVLIKSALQWLVDNHRIRKNYFSKIKKPKTNKTSKLFFTTSQKNELTSEIKQNDGTLYMCVQLLYYCFLRPAEQRKMICSDIILDEQKILVRSEISKNKKTEFVQIPSILFDDLNSYLQGKNPNDLLHTSNGKKISDNHFNNVHKSFLCKVNLNTGKHSLYSWKHTGVYQCLVNNMNIKQLQLQLRHHSLDQVNEYLKDFGLTDMYSIKNNFPAL